jgi:hypothetical protein
MLPPLPVPGTNAGMPFSVRILDAHIDLEPADVGLTLPSPLSLGANQFAILFSLEVCFMCGVLIDILVPRETELEKGGRPPAKQGGRPHVECAKLSIWAVGHALSAPNSRGGQDIGLQIDGIVVKDVGALEKLFECYFATMLNALLDALRVPIEQFALGAFGVISLADGPRITNDQLKAWATLS